MSRAALFFVLCFALASVIALTCVGIQARAQVDTSGGVDPLTVDVSPQNPAPYSTVTITPSSTQFDISGATVTVKVNGTPFYSGSGGGGITIPLDGPGTTSTITVTVDLDGKINTKTIVLKPASVALVVEPVSSSHPFYQGKGLVSAGATTRIVAIPDIRSSPSSAISPSQLVYTWMFGDQILAADSGVGKSVLNATAPPQYRDAQVSVTVSTQDGTRSAEAQTAVSPVTPITRVYMDDPLLGPLFDVALSDSITMTDAEDTYRGVGYYFSETPALTWQVDGTPSGSDQDLTVRSTGSGTGSAVLTFEADQNDQSLTANSTVSVQFGSAPSTGIFGL